MIIDSKMNQFKWTEFYQEFASKLLEYKNNRLELIEKMVEVFKSAEIKFSITEKDGETVQDICPFTVFGTFNKGITTNNRIKILTEISKLFAIQSDVPVVFDGIPILNNMKAWFFSFKEERGAKDIDNIWDVFEAAINFSDNKSAYCRDTFIKAFNTVLGQPGIRWNLTMALFWIRPFSYLNLDDRNRNYLLSLNATHFNNALPEFKNVPLGEKYLDVVDMCLTLMASDKVQAKTFPELSYDAWIVTSNQNPNEVLSKASFLKWFEPLIDALRILGKPATPEEVRNQIAQDMELSDEVLSERRGKNQTKKFDNELAFARNYLVYEGIIDKTIQGNWALTEYGQKVEMSLEIASGIFKKWVQLNNKKKEYDPGNSIEENIKSDTQRIWMYAPGENSYKWDDFYSESIMAIGWDYLGDLSNYNDKESIRSKIQEKEGGTGSYKMSVLATWQFANDIKIGDIIYVKKGTHSVIGRGIVESEYIFDKTRNEYTNIRQVHWTHRGEWVHPGKAAVKTLTDITPYIEYVDQLKLLLDIGDEIDPIVEKKVFESYSDVDFLSQVFIDSDRYKILTGLLKNKKNIIIQGPPGVGKTYAAKRLAYSIMGHKDTSRVMMVQFHQNYSYEDFIQGFRPSESGFKLVDGPFYSFCKEAATDDREYFFIIDEINRGNMSKIFGELLMLIENDKRSENLRLQYSNELFSVPHNVHIIGMMNTADRGLALIDYALRRRFAFFDMEPEFDSNGFVEMIALASNEKFERLVEIIKKLNQFIEEDEALGAGFRIGHSFLCVNKPVDAEWIQAVVQYELLPLINEYWFDEPDKVKKWSTELKSVLND